MTDFSKRFEKFNKQIEAFAEKANLSTSRAIRGSAVVLFRGVIQTSPVDTGRFRANWQVSGSSPATGTKDSFDKSGNNTAMEMSTYVNGEKVNLEFTLANNLPYAYKLEFGYSTQAPQGMVRINVARFQSILDEQARINR